MLHFERKITSIVVYILCRAIIVVGKGLKSKKCFIKMLCFGF